MKKVFNKRGTVALGDIPNIALTLVFVAALFVGGYLVLDGLGDASTDAGVQGSVGNMTSAFDNVIGYMPTIGTVVGVAVLIGIVIVGFAFARNRGAF